jgi:hypothetical protein
MTGICRSGETEGPTEGPSVETQTQAGRSDKDYWRIGHCTREGQTSHEETKNKLTDLTVQAIEEITT